MEKRVEIGLLFDFYGPLLTDRRSALVRMYCEEDLSLSEIAAETGVTRQSVHDALGQAERQLAEYESRLGLMARYLAIEKEIGVCRAALGRVVATGDTADELTFAKQALDRIERTQDQ